MGGAQKEEYHKKMDFTRDLPQDCVSKIISLTSPKDASRTSLVSSALKVAADSDAVWGSFLPSDLEDIISQSSSPTLISFPKKQLYFHLCDHPILIANTTKSFFLEKESGKKGCMIGARGLSVIWGDTPEHWIWTSLPNSRFHEVAELRYVWWLEINGRIETRLLSPNTRYAVFCVFKFKRARRGFNKRPMELSVNYEGNENGSVKRLLLDTVDESDEGPKQREDRWMEFKMGEFFNEIGADGFVVCRFWNFEGFVKCGLVVEGIEFRPKANV